MNKNKVILGLIIFVFLIIIIVGIVVLNLPNNKKETKTETENITEQVEKDQKENENSKNVPPSFVEEVGLQEFFTVDNCITKYFGYLDISNIDETTTSRTKIEKNIKAIMHNPNANIQFLQEKNIFTPLEVKKVNVSDVISYKVYGIVVNTQMEFREDKYFVVYLDTKNNTFSLDSYSGESQIQIDNIETISKNDNNSFKYQEISDQYKYKQIFNQIKRLMLAKPEIAYEYLDENYRTKRFGNLDYFKKYVENNREKLIQINPQKYKVDNNPDKILLVDQYNNWYEFQITGTMKYTAKIDNNVILLPQDVENYNNYSEEEKVKNNINRWIKMIDSKDYKFAYNFLDETFRENKYKTLEEFEKNMRQRYPSVYDINISNIEQDGNVWTAEVEISTEDNDFSDKYMTIVMRLDEGTNFTMSFSNQ